MINIPTERLRIITEHALSKGIPSAMAAYNLKKDTVQRYERELKKRTKDSTRLTEQVIQNGRITQTIISDNRFTTAEQLALYCDIDTSVYKATRIRTNQWGSDENPSWQFRVEWEPIKGLSAESVQQSVKKVLDNYVYPTADTHKVYPKGDKMLEIAIPDLHMGRLVETEGEPYNIGIAYDRWIDAHNFFFDKYKDTAVEQVVISIGNDFFNVDSKNNQTTHGTPQHEQSSYQVSFELGLQACVDAINLWRTKAKVHVVIVQGNHDEQRDYYLGTALKAWYRNDSDTIIQNEHTARKYVVYGKTLLGFSHGQKDYKRLSTVYHSEKREVLSDITFVEFHIGHMHQEKLTESAGGCVIRNIPSLASKSLWEQEMGYSGLKQAMAFLWDKERGLDTITYYTVTQ
jgi:hypothetical protein